MKPSGTFTKLADRLPKELSIIRELLTASLERSAERDVNAANTPDRHSESLKAMGSAE